MCGHNGVGEEKGVFCRSVSLWFFACNAVESARVVGMTREVAWLRLNWRADGGLYAATQAVTHASG